MYLRLHRRILLKIKHIFFHDDMKLKHNSPVVNVDWLYMNLESKDLVILDASFPKIGEDTATAVGEGQIKGSIYFDLKNIFQNKNSMFPNTIPAAEHFQKEVQKLGIKISWLDIAGWRAERFAKLQEELL